MEDNKKPDLEQGLPEDFRPVIPEPEIRRRSIIQFSKNYPVEDSPTSTHTMSFAQQQARRRTIKAVLYVSLLLIVFSLSFIITDTFIKISKEPIPQTVPSQPCVSSEAATQEYSADTPSGTESEITQIEGSTFFVYTE